MSETDAKPRAKRSYQSHGLYMIERALAEANDRSVQLAELEGEPGRAWRRSLIADLGDDPDKPGEHLSIQQLAIVELACRTWLMLQVVDTFLLERGAAALINKRNRKLYTIVLEREKLAGALVRYLETLGLQRQARRLTLHDVLREHEARK